MIRVLHINAGTGVFGGVSTFCLNLYRNIDRNAFQFDFLTSNKTTYSQYREEIEEYGGSIFELGINARSILGKVKLYRALKHFLAEHVYDIIQINSGVLLFNLVAALACRKYSKSRIFVHSHSNGGRSPAKERLSGILKWLLVLQADQLLACSQSAAEYMFPLECVPRTAIINNGISVDAYRYNEEIRQKVRRELGVEDRYVIGHVGRFTAEKNQIFLIDLLTAAQKRYQNVCLMLIGEGPQMEMIRQRAKQKGIDKIVIMLGARSDVNRLYQAMDVFVLPSIYEGFGIVNLEAQAAGLKCIVSTSVPEIVNLTGNVVRLSLDAPMESWLDAVFDVPLNRHDCSGIIRDNGFDIVTSAKEMERQYRGEKNQ